MNRQQAEHILDAYVRMRMRGGDDDAVDSLREVILDAMVDFRTGIYPTITLPSTKPLVTYTDTADPNVVKPSVTTSSSTAEIVGYKDGIVKVVSE